MSSLCTTVLGKYPREPVALKAENVSGLALEAAIQTTLCEREPSSCHVFAGKKKSSFQILIETIPSLNVRSFGAARAWIISWVTSIMHVLGHRWTLRIRSLFNRKRKKKKFYLTAQMLKLVKITKAIYFWIFSKLIKILSFRLYYNFSDIKLIVNFETLNIRIIKKKNLLYNFL